MPTLTEFLELFDAKKFDEAMKTYKVLSAASLDANEAETVWTAARQESIAFDFAGPNVITMRKAVTGDTKQYSISYLPWKRGEVTSMTLAGSPEPGFFSTSQMNGCRFTIHYADDSKKSVTVLHGAGNLSRAQRETGESTVINNERATGRTRSYSINRGTHDLVVRGDTQGLAAYNLTKTTRLAYDGGMAWIFGARSSDGVWSFFAQAQKYDSTTVVSLKTLM